jgi:ABC-type transport system substrate-binding protein
MPYLLAIVIAFTVVLAGTPAGAQAPGPQITVAQLYNPEDMSPWNFTALATVDIWAHFMEPLTVFDRQGTLHGVVAESWQMVSPTEWAVKVRRGLRNTES